jgi:hypothetical protein
MVRAVLAKGENTGATSGKSSMRVTQLSCIDAWQRTPGLEIALAIPIFTYTDLRLRMII